MRSLVERNVFKRGRAGNRSGSPLIYVVQIGQRWRMVFVGILQCALGRIICSIHCKIDNDTTGGGIGVRLWDPPIFSVWWPLQLIAADHPSRPIWLYEAIDHLQDGVGAAIRASLFLNVTHAWGWKSPWDHTNRPVISWLCLRIWNLRGFVVREPWNSSLMSGKVTARATLRTINI